MDDALIESAVMLSGCLDRALRDEDTSESDLLRLTASAVNLLLLDVVKRLASTSINVNKEKG